MSGTLPPAPINEPQGSFAWQQWYSQLSNLYSVSGAIPWSAINTNGSNITDIASRAHNNLQSTQGGTSGEYYHLTSAEHTELQTVVNGTWVFNPTTPAGAAQTNTALYGGSGAPNNANGNNGDFYFRSDGGAGTRIYFKTGGSWTGIV